MWLRRAAVTAVVTGVLATVVAAPISSGAVGVGSSTRSVSLSSTATTTTTTTATTTTTLGPSKVGAQAPIAAGPSRSECLEPNFTDSGLVSLQFAITKFDQTTDSSVTCVSTYLNSSEDWTEWVHPWVVESQYGYTSWVAEDPLVRQLVLAVNLVPLGLDNLKNPLHWERSCAGGKFDSYATQLGKNLVAAGLGNSVIRLGAEMNGIWEGDFIGTTKHEQNLWAECFANEVTGLRQAPREAFLIDWNPNACKGNYPYANFYPGNAYVNIVGLDLYDVDCEYPKTAVTFSQLANEPAGLTKFEAFASAKGKPMSFPEWGLTPFPSGDDPLYVDGMASTIAGGDFAFESYFDANLEIRAYLQMGLSAPQALAEFQKWFGDGS